MPKVASPSGDSSRLAPCRSRVRTPARANFSPQLKKTPSMCSPNGMALVGMARIGFFFLQTEKLLSLPLNEIWWGPFQPPPPRPHFFLNNCSIPLSQYDILQTTALHYRPRLSFWTKHSLLIHADILFLYIGWTSIFF